MRLKVGEGSTQTLLNSYNNLNARMATVIDKNTKLEVRLKEAEKKLAKLQTDRQLGEPEED